MLVLLSLIQSSYVCGRAEFAAVRHPERFMRTARIARLSHATHRLFPVERSGPVCYDEQWGLLTQSPFYEEP